MRTYENRGKENYVTANACFPYKFFLSKNLVHKVIAIITRHFIGFVKISALLKTPVPRNYVSFFFFVWYMINPES